MAGHAVQIDSLPERPDEAIKAGEATIIERLGPTLLEDDWSPDELKRITTLPTQQMEILRAVRRRW